MSDCRTTATNPTDQLLRQPLGRTGFLVSQVGLGGGGVLRTHGRWREAASVIERALSRGINLFDTSAAWAGSEEYMGAALAGHRRQVCLSSKTHDRTRDGSLRLLEASLRRLRTDYLDIWQIQDVRTNAQLERIFAPGGAANAGKEARGQGIVRSFGIAGQFDPLVLTSALASFDFDVVALPINAADIHRLSFQALVLPAARNSECGIIGQQATAEGRFLDLGVLSLSEALGYALSQPGVSTTVIDCETPDDVDEHLRALEEFQPFGLPMLRSLEERSRRHCDLLTHYKCHRSQT